MLRRMRPKNLLDWGIAASYLSATLLMIWAATMVDWWSTATALFEQEFEGDVTYAPLTVDGRSLLSGYAGVAIGLILLVVSGWLMAARNRVATAMLGIVGVTLTVVAMRLDSPVAGLVHTNAWIPAALTWFFYFGALVTRLATQAPQLEFEPRPDSSDG